MKYGFKVSNWEDHGCEYFETFEDTDEDLKLMKDRIAESFQINGRDFVDNFTIHDKDGKKLEIKINTQILFGSQSSGWDGLTIKE